MLQRKNYLRRIGVEKINKRSNAFELLRLVAMFMVVWGHCVMATAKDQEPYLGTLDNIGWFIGAFTVCAVNEFFLLTGYFARSDNFKVGRILTIWLKTFTYSTGIYIVASCIQQTFSMREMITYMLPITTKQYWYMQVYIVLFFLTPYISLCMEHLTKKQHTFLIAVLLVFFSLHQTFIKVARTLDQSQGYGIIWAVVMLIIGNWLKKYGNEYIEKIRSGLFLIAYTLCSVVIFISNYLVVRLDIAGGITSRGNFYAYNSITVLVQSICLFCWFIQLSRTMENHKYVNWLGKNTLAVYLISAHPMLLYPLWTDVFHMSQYWDKPVLYVALSIIFTIIVMILCICVDKIVDGIAGKLGVISQIKKVNRLIGF